MKNKLFPGLLHRRHKGIIVAAIFAVVLLVGAGGYAALNKYPSIGAQGADLLRKVVGDEAVARLEGAVFQAQDFLRRLQYQAGSVPQAPWSAAPANLPTTQETTAAQAAVAIQTAEAVGQLLSQPTQLGSVQNTETYSGTPASGVPVTPQLTPMPPLPTPDAVCPTSVAAIGTMPGEGIWSPYLSNNFSGKIAACRTFFQPDPERPYAVVAVVAFTLEDIDLHYVLGSQEPASDIPISRPGVIAPEDLQPDLLLAVFNGGFKTRHGNYGVMAEGVTLVPPRDGFGTIAMYKNGLVRIGAWGSDITESPELLVWRQNGPLLVQNGQTNPRTNNQSIQDWGSTVDGSFPVATWRSAMGISADNKTLYYAAGPSLTLQSLAQALITAGASQAVQLDINNYWVYFGEVVFNDGKPKTIPLFPDWKDNPDRYLGPYIRDFFYVTAKHNK
jgi:hypothetical protein